MKKLFVWLMVLVMVLALTGCRSTPVSDDVETGDRFVVVVDQDFNNVYADTETGVMYYFHKSGYGGGMTVLVDADGKPLLWEG